MSTKTHARHALGNAVRRLATAGQANDCPPAIPLLVGAAAAQLIADTACDSDENRAGCSEKGINAAIPNRPNRTDRPVRRRTARRPQQD